MDFITVPNYRLAPTTRNYMYQETINIENIVSFDEDSIYLKDGRSVLTFKETTQELAKYLRNKRHNITKIGV